MNRPEFVNAPYPTTKKPEVMISSPDKDRPQLTATKPMIDSITFQPRHAPERKEMHYSTCEGRSQTQATRSMSQTRALMSDRGLNLLLEKYWQCGDKSHHDKEMHTLFNSILTYKKLFSTSL